MNEYLPKQQEKVEDEYQLSKSQFSKTNRQNQQQTPTFCRTDFLNNNIPHQKVPNKYSDINILNNNYSSAKSLLQQRNNVRVNPLSIDGELYQYCKNPNYLIKLPETVDKIKINNNMIE